MRWKIRVNAVPDQIKSTDAANKFIGAGESQQWWEFLTHSVPTSVVGPFVDGNILQIIFFAVLFGVALNATGKYGAPVLDGIQRASTRAPHGNLASERRCAARHPWHAGLEGRLSQDPLSAVVQFEVLALILAEQVEAT